MKDRKLRYDLYSAFVWAIFSLGATQLALVLGGSIAFLIVLICCASIFTFFLVKTEVRGNRSPARIARPYLLSTGILIIINLFYVGVVFFRSDLADVIFISFLFLLFIVPLLICIPFLRSRSHVSK